MLDPAITGFFDERKEAWLKKNVKSSMDENEIKELQVKCEHIFSVENWLPDAAKRICSRAITSHPSKFSHPSTGVGKKNIKEGTFVTPVIHKANFIADGFMKSGNVNNVVLDSVGNAAELDVEEFLSLKLLDGETVLSNIERDSDFAKKLLDIKSNGYSELRNGLLSIKSKDVEITTNSKIKQVYFPVEDDYHQLSILTNSGMLYQLRKRIDTLRFSDEVKALRDLKNKKEYSERGFSEIYGLTTIGYGGTKPQNISVLNNQNGGKAHLLSSLPPQIEKRSIHFPRSNFFTESFRSYEYKELFQALHRIFKIDYKNNKQLRDRRDAYLQTLVDRIIDKMWAIRSVSVEQYYSETSQLSRNQKVWLHSDFMQEREETDEWLDTLVNEISSWITTTYKKTIGKQAVMLGEEERLHFFKIVAENKEALR